MADPQTHLSEAKERYLLEGQKTYIAINGAGAAALLAFLQAIWAIPTAAPLRPWVLCGIMLFAVGVVIAASSFVVRHLGSSPAPRTRFFSLSAGALVHSSGRPCRVLSRLGRPRRERTSRPFKWQSGHGAAAVLVTGDDAGGGGPLEILRSAIIRYSGSTELMGWTSATTASA